MIRCLREQSIDNILVATRALALIFLPLHGDQLFPLDFPDAVKQKTTNFDIDLMFGLVNDEGTAFIIALFPELYFNHAKLSFQGVIKRIPKILHFFNIRNESLINETIRYYTANLPRHMSSQEHR